METLKGKRKKKRPKCANPLFERWLQEWTDEAAEKGWKSQYTYAKALKAIRQFPLHLATGKDCKILQHFGDKICKMLDDKLSQHVATHGSVNSVSSDDELNKQVYNAANQKQTKKSAIQSATATDKPMDTVDSISQDSDDGSAGAPQKKRRKSSENKPAREYIPAPRSGPYAILLALYRNMQDPDTRGFMTKAEITRDAELLADKSFFVPDPGCRYTAWSSMGTLIKKGLVIKESSPAKYSLSDAGRELSARLEAVYTGGAAAIVTEQPARVPPLPRANPPPPLHTLSDSDEDMSHLPQIKHPRQTKTHSMSDSEGETTPVYTEPTNSFDTRGTQEIENLKFWYVTEDSRLVTRKDEAAVLIDDIVSIGFLIKCNYNSLIASGKRYKLDTTRHLGSDFVYAFLCDTDAVEIASPPDRDETKSKKKSKPKSVLKKDKSLSSGAEGDTGSLQSRLLGKKEISRPTISRSDYSTSNHSTDDTSSLSDRLNGVKSVEYTPKLPQFGVRQDDEDSLPDVTPINSLPSSQSSTVSSSASCRSLPPPDFVLRPGTFDVVLCVDNREFYGGSKCQSKTLLPDLIKNGVECDLRELQIGDMLWIAREKVHALPGQLEKPKGRELVIDFIVERKRMDDLVSSMIDGRFREQKFRLKRSGIANAIYLIEDYGSLQHFSIAEERIKQAMVNTQVIDGFKIKRTSGVKETVAYLTVMTRYLQSFYRNKTLQACTPEMLRGLDNSFHIEESEKLLTTFQHFNHASVKSKDLTVRELFGKQLVQLHGISADKAKAITDRYPTPTSIFQAYDSCVSQREKEGLLANIKSGKGMRNLGNAQSKQIYQLYCTHSPLT